MTRSSSVRRAREEANAKQRLDELFGLESLFWSAVWSNATCEAFCLHCGPEANEPTIDLRLPAETICASCGKRIDGEQP